MIQKDNLSKPSGGYAIRYGRMWRSWLKRESGNKESGSRGESGRVGESEESGSRKSPGRLAQRHDDRFRVRDDHCVLVVRGQTTVASSQSPAIFAFDNARSPF